MTQLRKILCATDFSEPADQAWECALALARVVNASVDLVHVFETPWFAWPDLHVMQHADAKGVTTQGMLSWFQDEARKQLKARTTGSSGSGIHRRGHLIEQGPVFRALTHLAGEIGADLIVVGTRGRGGAARALLGSVAERVVRTSMVPVLTIPPAGEN